MANHRICLTTHLFPVDSTDYKGSFILDMARELARRGCEVHVVTPRRPGAAESERVDGVHIHRYPHFGWRDGRQLGDIRGVPVLRLTTMVARGIAACIAVVRRYDLDLIHAYWVVPSGTVAVAAGRATGRPVVSTAAGSDLNSAPQNRLFRPVIAATLRRLDGLIAVSSQIADIALQLGLSKSRLHVVPGPAGVRISTPDSNGNNRENSAKVLYVGNLTAPKRVDTIIRAMQRVVTQVPDAELTVVGDGGLRRQLEALVRSLKLTEHVCFRGAVAHDDLPPVLAAADVFVHCSENEGLPVAIMEALGAGLPVIAADVGGIPQLVIEGRTGYRLGANDDTGFADRIVTLLRDPALRAKLGDNGRTMAEKSLSITAVISALIDVYDTVLQNNRELESTT